MKKILLVINLLLFCFVSFGQVYQEMPQYGYRANRMIFDSTLSIPTTCGVPTLRSNITKKAAIAFDSCNNKLYQYNPKTLTWSEIAGGGSTDTTSLSNRINLKLNISDTASMLSPYLRKVDTASLSNRINLKLNISDTINKWVTSVTKLNDSTIRVLKDGTNTDITLTPAATVTSATRLVTNVYNNTGSTIPKGSVVYISGRHSSNLPTIALALGNSEENSYKTFALVENDITNNNSGIAIQAGNIANLNLPTSTYTDGDILYLSPTVAGAYTITKPLAPNHICKLGSVTRAHPSQGSIEIKIENGWQLDELSDVQIALVPADSTILQFSRVDSLWHDVSINNAIGTKYLKPTDTTSLSNRINTKLSTSDSTIYYTKFRSDTSRTNIYNQLAQELNIADSTIYYTKFRSDTSRSNIYSAINTKSAGYALMLGALAGALTGGGTIYFGHPSRAAAGTAAIHRIYIPQSGTIKSVYIISASATAGTSESWTMSVRLNNASNTSIGSVSAATTTRVWSGTGLNIAVVAGDYVEITTTNPSWATAPGSTSWYGTIYIQ